MPSVTHDVTDLLREGDNALGIVLADGWWAGRISILGRSAQYGDLLRASWRLEVDLADGTSEVIVPDESVVSDRGPIDYSDLFIGERHDARRAVPGWSSPGFDAGGWQPGRLVDVEIPVVPHVGEPVRPLLELPVHEIRQTPAGETVVDFGQVIAGRVRLTARGPAGTTIRLEHAEVVDGAGNFLRNIIGVDKDQVDEFVLAGDEAGETWEPEFTFHGFRYVKVIGWPGELLSEDLTAVVLGSDLEQTGDLTCSDPRLNQLVQNTRWSQRANFLAVPTDCPQCERAGWTGDLQIFTPTAATLMGVAAFLRRWFADVRAEQAARDGMVPIIVPMPPAMDLGATPPSPSSVGADPHDIVALSAGLSAIDGAAGWGDVITMTPWELYRRYGDVSFLQDNVAAMRSWVDWQTREAARLLTGRLRDTDLDAEARARHAVLWNGALNFGDWLAPSTLADAEHEFLAMMTAPLTTHEIVGPCFQARSLDVLADTEEVLGDGAAAAALRQRAQTVRDAFSAEYLTEQGRLTTELQGTYVLALAFDMVTSERRAGLVDRLVELIHQSGDHLDTGFPSVPYLLDVLWDNDHADLAWTLLLQDAIPSWLYEVRMGATMIWESWNAVHPDGTVDAVSMNHYAFGCVVDTMMRRIAVIGCVEPGFRVSRVAPDLSGRLDRCAAHVLTPYGRLAVDWRRDEDGRTASVVVDVPTSTTARLELPTDWRLEPDSAELGAGRHELLAIRRRPRER
nr:alpha-L-rhamnosidase [Arsenicicoccus piscis]